MITNVVLDIDGVLAARNADCLENAIFFKNKGMIMTVIKTHYIFPGVIEFIKFLFETKDVKVSFYSSGAEIRNVDFVKNLLKICVEKSKYKELKKKITILSKNDLVNCMQYESNEQYRLYGISPGSNQKDIKKVILKDGGLLENSVLIDDDKSCIACGQAKNILLVEATKAKNFSKLKSNHKFCQPNGYVFLPCYLNKEIEEYDVRMVKLGKHILILKSDENFEVCFLHKEFGYQKKTINIKEIPQLVELSNNFEMGRYRVKDYELLKNICELVNVFGGHMQRICKGPNRIFYAAGLLSTALEESKREKIPISEVLFRKQFKLNEDGKTYQPDFNTVHKMENLYWLGLEKLRAFNPNLQFTNPINYVECIKLPISEDEKLELEKFIKNEETGCCIM